jgi:hypothetical protein
LIEKRCCCYCIILKKDRKRRDLIKKEGGDTVRHIDRDRDMDYSESFVKEHMEKVG